MPTSDTAPDELDGLLGGLSAREGCLLTLGMGLTRLGRINELLFERSAGECGLNGSEATTLVALSMSGPPHRMLPSEIRRQIAHTSAGVSGILRRLEAEGLVERQPDPSDGRRVFVTITPAGDEIVRRFVRQHAVLLGTCLADVDDAGLVGHTDALDALLAPLERHAGFAPALRRARAAAGRSV